MADELPFIPGFMTLDLGGEEPAKVSDVSGFSVSTGEATYISNDANGQPQTTNVPGNSGATSKGTLTVGRMIDSSMAFYDWIMDAKKPGNDPSEFRKDLILTMKDQAGETRRVYNIKMAFPTNWSGEAYSASSGEPAMENLTFVYDSFEVTVS